eukprot:1141783-Pelagomonas_calceolata.AAC.1
MARAQEWYQEAPCWAKYLPYKFYCGKVKEFPDPAHVFVFIPMGIFTNPKGGAAPECSKLSTMCSQKEADGAYMLPSARSSLHFEICLPAKRKQTGLKCCLVPGHHFTLRSPYQPNRSRRGLNAA